MQCTYLRLVATSSYIAKIQVYPFHPQKTTREYTSTHPLRSTVPRRKELLFIRDQQTGDARASEGRDGAGQQGTYGQSGDIATSFGRDL